MNQLKIILLVSVGMLATACTESKYSKMSDAELNQKKRHCDSIPKKSPVFATGCENIAKEIERRRKEKRK
ncbi:hypothetical protein [Aliikangiella coralliicola]|uniref:Uncharacterized protein n=1 Tax=Aliikangiella coralliicola TaxID=2592383 RepID=A0A545TVZ8_9GAMM|nr:hypothetical protein [Aliikangiella coralliicola]TQV81400.1 hypothetical protein FLL46_24935 [Aliikangiella coralliicola]